MVQYTFQSCPRQQSLKQKIAKKHLKLHLKRIRDREYGRLREMVPSIAKKDKVSKIVVIEEAVKYIDELHRALIERLNSKGLNDGVVNESNVKDFVFSLMPQNVVQKRDFCTYEKQQSIPSFHRQLQNKLPKSL